MAAKDSDRMHKRQPIRIGLDLQRGFVHQAPNGEVRQEEAKTFLADEVGRFAPQDDLGPAQMRLQFVERGFDFRRS